MEEALEEIRKMKVGLRRKQRIASLHTSLRINQTSTDVETDGNLRRMNEYTNNSILRMPRLRPFVKRPTGMYPGDGYTPPIESKV